MRRVSQLLPIWVDKDGAHVAIALVHEKSSCMWAEVRKWLRGPVVHSLLCRNQLPCPNNAIANVRFHVSVYCICSTRFRLFGAPSGCRCLRVGYYIDPLRVRRGLGLVVVMPVPPLVRRRLRVACRRVLPLL